MARKVVVEAPTGAKAGLARRETFTNASDIRASVDGVILTDTQYDDLLTFRGVDDLVQRRVIKSFEGQIESSQTFKYGEHYLKGDIVQIVTENNIEAKVRIAEVINSQSPSGEDVYLTVKTIE